MRGAPRLEAHPNYNVGPQPIARARAAVGTHTHPFCFYNFKSQTGCVSSATVFTALLMSAFVPPPHLPQFFACPPPRLSSAAIFLKILITGVVAKLTYMSCAQGSGRKPWVGTKDTLIDCYHYL